MGPKHRQGIDYIALANFRYEVRRFLSFSEQAARAAGIEPQHHQALLAIKGLPVGRTATVGVLAEKLHIRHHSAVELANRMDARGLIRKRRRSADRREVVLSLTAHGEELLKTLTRLHRAELQMAAPKLLGVLGAAIGSNFHPGQPKKPGAKKNGLSRKEKRLRHTNLKGKL